MLCISSILGNLVTTLSQTLLTFRPNPRLVRIKDSGYRDGGLSLKDLSDQTKIAYNQKFFMKAFEKKKLIIFKHTLKRHFHVLYDKSDQQFPLIKWGKQIKQPKERAKRSST